MTNRMLSSIGILTYGYVLGKALTKGSMAGLKQDVGSFPASRRNSRMCRESRGFVHDLVGEHGLEKEAFLGQCDEEATVIPILVP